jgi:hypothetical protein
MRKTAAAVVKKRPIFDPPARNCPRVTGGFLCLIQTDALPELEAPHATRGPFDAALG